MSLLEINLFRHAKIASMRAHSEYTTSDAWSARITITLLQICFSAHCIMLYNEWSSTNRTEWNLVSEEGVEPSRLSHVAGIRCGSLYIDAVCKNGALYRSRESLSRSQWKARRRLRIDLISGRRRSEWPPRSTQVVCFQWRRQGA